MKLISKTIGQCLKDTVQNYGNCTALENEEWNCSYAELDMITDLLAGIINRRWGIYKGTHVGIWSLNTPNYVFMYIALAKIGAITCVLNTYLKTEEISNILNQADIEVLFYGMGCRDVIYDDLIPEIRKHSPNVRYFLHLGDQKNDIWTTKDFFRNYEQKHILKQVIKLKEKVKPKDVACIIFTSGTTSSPKGVQLSHFGIVNDASYTACYMHWTHKDKMCIAVPLFHCFGLITGVLCGIIQGMTIHLIHYFKAALVWRAIHQFHCTILNGVPSMFLAMIHKKEFEDFVAEHMNSGIIGGSIVSAEDYLEIRKHFPGMHLQTSYGMTETSATISISEWNASPVHQAITNGKLISGMEGRIVNIETGEVLPPGREGEIQLRGFNVFLGYYNMPEKTKDAFTDDGWFKTGDMGLFMRNKEIRVTGRIKEIIIRSGENISPAEIENVIIRSGLVSKVKVIGVPSKMRQEEVAACIIPIEKERFNAEELLDFISPLLASFKRPKYVLIFDEFPMTASGKYNLSKIKETAISFICERNEACYVRK